MTTTIDTPTLPPVIPSAPAGTADFGEIARARGILVSLEISAWTGRRLDRRVTTDTNNRAGADEDAGRFNKHLLGGKVPSFDAVQARAQGARNALYRETLPWTDEGTRLLPITNYFEFSKIIREQKDAFKTAVDAFLAEYPALVEAAENRLGTMYNPAEYPSVEALSGRFSFAVRFTPIPAAADIRCDLPPEILAGIEKRVTSQVESSVRNAARDGWDRLYQSVERIRDRLREIAAEPGKGRLHGSIFSGAVQTAETLKRLNVLADPELDAMADRIIAEIGALDPKAVRETPDTIAETAKAADAILDAMTGIYGGNGAA